VGGLAALVLGLASVAIAPAGAEELWQVRSGHVLFHFNLPLLRDLGIDLEVHEVGLVHDDERVLEEPTWSFPIRSASDLRIRTEHGIPRPPGGAAGSAGLGGAIVLRNCATGAEIRLSDLELAGGDLAGGAGTVDLRLRSAASGLVAFDLVHSMFDFRRKEQTLEVHYMNARLTAQAASAIGRPEVAGWWIGMGELRGAAERIAYTPPSRPAPRPHFAGGGLLDVRLGALSSIQEVGHEGSFPGGAAALSLVTTVCNIGEVDVPWLEPMAEDHPLIHMALYRLLDGRFEQIGVSWVKHGFFAQSGSACTACQNPSDGTFLGVGCSDTYSIGNNSNRAYLGPRSEIDPYTATWVCTGSHFAGGQPDCERRHYSTEHGVLDHRLTASDADLDNPGATYYYEANYLVRGDQNPLDNWGSRLCTMSWDGSVWHFVTPVVGNPLVAGPALGRWGEFSASVPAAAGDGEVLLAVQTSDLGGGRFHYEYALLNLNSDREIRSFRVPVAGVPNVTGIAFHDSDGDPANDWTASLESDALTWQTETYAQNPNANALVFGYLFNFRFDADAPPAALEADLGLFRPGSGSRVAVETRGPTNTPSAVNDPAAGRRGSLTGISPNPFHASTRIAYALATTGTVSLAIYDAGGRLVRELVNGTRHTGPHEVEWDGTTGDGARAPAGVYFVRLRAGSAMADQALVVRK
jgi:hypothetical protein